MAKENNMSLFDSDDIELNLDDASFEDLGLDDEENTAEEEDATETDTDDESIFEGDNPNAEETTDDENSSEEEETSSEDVAGEDDDEGGDENDSPNLYSSLASVLYEQGLLPSLNLDESKVNNIEDITKAFKAEIESNVKNKLVEKLGEDGYEAINSGVSMSDFAKSRENQDALNSIADTDLEDPELAKRVIYQDYINQGMTEDRAKKLLKRIVDSGDEALLEDASESLTSLKAYEQKQLETKKEQLVKDQQFQAKQQEELDTKIKDKIYNSEELLKGIKLNKAIKDKVYSSMTEVIGKNEQGVLENKLMRERRENPIEFDTKLYYLYELTNGFKDFANISNKSRSSAITELEKSMRQTNRQDQGTPSFLEDGDSYLGLGDELVL